MLQYKACANDLQLSEANSLFNIYHNLENGICLAHNRPVVQELNFHKGLSYENRRRFAQPIGLKRR